MKQITYVFLLLMAINQISIAQEYISTNRKPVGLEYNILFNANNIYTVSQTGSAQLNLSLLFNGILSPSYTASAPSVTDPTVIIIEGLPKVHIQAGSWIGWTTRYWPAKNFKVEGYDEYYSNGWTVFADYSSTDYTGPDFITKIPPGSYTKLRFTFYEGSGTDGRLGVSELIFIHPEAASPYANLIGGGSLWNKSGSDVTFTSGKIGIGTTAPTAKLTVKGDILATKVQIVSDDEIPASDYVFEPGYNLRSLSEVEQFVKTNKHLPEVPSATEFKENGYSVGEMDDILLRKVEELTLYTIEQQKELNEKDQIIRDLITRIEKLENEK